MSFTASAVYDQIVATDRVVKLVDVGGHLRRDDDGVGLGHDVQVRHADRHNLLAEDAAARSEQHATTPARI